MKTPVSSPTQAAAMWMFDLGLNVFPLPYGQKYGSHWKFLQCTRLDRDLLDYDLQYGDRCNLAVMVGRTSDNLFVLDYETHEGFRAAILALHKRDIPVWAVSTTRGGHIWLRCEAGAVKSVRHDDMELRGDSGYVLAPPSLNAASGVFYEWLLREGDEIPTVTLKQLDFLPFPLHLERPPKTVPDTPHRLNRRTREYIQHGRTYKEGIRHISFFCACCDYAAKGCTLADIYRDLVPVAKDSGLGNDGDSDVFRRVSEWAVTHVHPRQRQAERTFTWQRALTFLNEHEWKGRQGSTDYAVATALIERARKFTREDGSFRGSYRELQEWAHVGNRQTLKNALNRLQEIAFISYVGRDELSTASLWRFNEAVLQTEPSRENTGLGLDGLPCNLSSGSVLPPSDALERGALGITGWRVYRALLGCGETLSRREIAAASGLTVGQVSYALRPDGWLRKVKLVERLDSAWSAIAVSAAELDEKVALPAGKLGRGARRAALHDKERSAFAAKIVLRLQPLSYMTVLKAVCPGVGFTASHWEHVNS